MTALGLIASGLVVGLLSGVFGIGGGVIVVPLLVMLFGFGQKLAQGTSLAMFLITPSLLATFAYFKTGNVDFKASGLLWIGTFIGSMIGAYYVTSVMPDSMIIYLRRAFCILMVLIAVKMWFTT